jgi:protein gp37
MNKTSIEWADYVWNPVSGCSKVSPGCKNCYAEAMAHRFWGERKFTDVICHEDRLDQPLHIKKPGRVFVNSMSDLFHPSVPDEFIVSVWMRMLSTTRHTYIILTKRPDRMLEIVSKLFRLWPEDKVFAARNVWLGVSVENQAVVNDRLRPLMETPAAKRFVSVEPMLERIDLGEYLCETWSKGGATMGTYLDWVICGGESGPGARPHPPYIDVRYLKDQCVEAGVPFFLKQMWGQKMPELDGQIWNQYPEAK